MERARGHNKSKKRHRQIDTIKTRKYKRKAAKVAWNGTHPQEKKKKNATENATEVQDNTDLGFPHDATAAAAAADAAVVNNQQNETKRSPNFRTMAPTEVGQLALALCLLSEVHAVLSASPSSPATASVSRQRRS